MKNNGNHATLDTRFLEGLIGYNARRASMAIGEVFYERMAPYGLRQADFSVLVLLAHNPGATSRQLCATLNILPPNFAAMRSATPAGSLSRSSSRWPPVRSRTP